MIDIAVTTGFAFLQHMAHTMLCPHYSILNPLPALTYQNVLDLNVACWAKHTQTYWHVRKFKCPLKKRSLPAHAVGI
jgi:hypothetical protein